MTFEEFMEEPVNSAYALLASDLKRLKETLSVKTLEELINIGNEPYNMPFQSVVNKEKIVFVKDKHDYESFSIYSWPNPNTIDGLPYIKRDGYQNPEHLMNDKKALRAVAYIVYVLGILYYFTKDKKYYQKLKDHLNVFFINPETKMNPHLNHGQALPGVNDGQSGGIIDFAVSFGYTLSILTALKNEQLLENNLVASLSKWLDEFLKWLLEDDFGKDMAIKKNNHSLVYDYVVLIISLFLKRDKNVDEVKNRYFSRIASQIKEDGLMPEELKRNKSRSYFFMNLKLFIEIGRLLEIDIKNISALSNAFRYYLNHDSEEKWEYPQVKKFIEVQDNYMYYINKTNFGYGMRELKKSNGIHYLLFKDYWGKAWS